MIANQAKAQSGFGIRAGLAFSDTKVDLIDAVDINFKSKTGLDIAVFYNYEAGNGVSLQPEVHYVQLGFKIDVFGIISPRGDLDYIRIPLLIKYDLLNANENLNLSPFIGPYFGILVSENVDLVSIIADIPFKNTDVGLDFGLNLKLANGLFFDARYTLGFQNIVDDAPIGELKNSSIALGIGYQF